MEREGNTMNKKERVDAALRGDEVDRIPVSMWGHDFEREWNVQSFAEAMVEIVTEWTLRWQSILEKLLPYALAFWEREAAEFYKAPKVGASKVCSLLISIVSLANNTI